MPGTVPRVLRAFSHSILMKLYKVGITITSIFPMRSPQPREWTGLPEVTWLVAGRADWGPRRALSAVKSAEMTLGVI